MIESKSTKYDRVRQSPKIVRLPTSTMFVKCLRLKMWIPVVLSITSYLICLVHVVQRYVAMLTARTLQKYSHWIPQKIYQSLHDAGSISLGDIPLLASSSIDRASVGSSYFDIDGTGLEGYSAY